MRAAPAVLSLLLGLAACGDPPICQSEVFVAIQTSLVNADVDVVALGVQADIRVRTSLGAGEFVTLEVFSANGAATGTVEAAVDDDGFATFTAVTVTTPATRLRATVDTLCGTGLDELTIEVRLGEPEVELEIFAPPLPCGAQITPTSDIDPDLPDTQIGVRVTSSTGIQRTLELSTPSQTASFDATDDLIVTVEPGQNQLVGGALDPLGNIAQTAVCTVTLSDLSVSFAPPAASGTLARKDGNVVGDTLTFPLCGTVNRAGATVELAIDGGVAIPATVTQTSWCRTLTLDEAPHTIVATARAGSSFGSSTLSLRVDVTPPPSVADFTAIAINRQRIRMAWTAPDDGGQPAADYVAKLATTAITEENFDGIGTAIPTLAPQAGGTLESVELPARTGTAFWIGIATRDAAGNRSPVAVIGPVTPGFDRTGSITAPDPAQGALRLGYAFAHGKFNNDELDDLAVSAPTQDTSGGLQAGAVYVYFGGSSVIGAVPDLVITGALANGQLGAGLAAARWSSSTRDDLVVGAPGGDGRIFVFRGGSTFGSGTRSASTAELNITVSSTAAGFFAGSALGSSLASADVDGDGTADLVASAPTGGATSGGIAILYGDTLTGDVVLSDLDASGANGAIIELFRDPELRAGHQVGFYLHAIGRLGGASDTTEDLAIGELDDYAAPNGSLYLLRGDGTRPVTPGVSPRVLTVGRDVQIDLITGLGISEFGSQVTSIEDQTGDGVRELVVSAHRLSVGQVFILSGSVLGTAGIATTAEPGVRLATLTGTGNSRFGAFVLGHDESSTNDIDGDGREDLAIGAVLGTVGKMFVWFGGGIPTGTASLATAQLVLDAPATMTFKTQTPKGFAGRAHWVGDLDSDGLEDLCWTSPFDNGGDGSFEVLAD